MRLMHLIGIMLRARDYRGHRGHTLNTFVWKKMFEMYEYD